MGHGGGQLGRWRRQCRGSECWLASLLSDAVTDWQAAEACRQAEALGEEDPEPYCWGWQDQGKAYWPLREKLASTSLLWEASIYSKKQNHPFLKFSELLQWTGDWEFGAFCMKAQLPHNASKWMLCEGHIWYRQSKGRWKRWPQGKLPH